MAIRHLYHMLVEVGPQAPEGASIPAPQCPRQSKHALLVTPLGLCPSQPAPVAHDPRCFAHELFVSALAPNRIGVRVLPESAYFVPGMRGTN